MMKFTTPPKALLFISMMVLQFAVHAVALKIPDVEVHSTGDENFPEKELSSPDCPIFDGRFNLPNGATEDPSPTGWFLDASQVPNAQYFAVRSNRLMAENLNGEGVWFSREISAQGYSDFQVLVKLVPEGPMNSDEYVKLFLRIDGGPEIPMPMSSGGSN
ncbi:MAG: hypothetical protein AAF551_12900 [Bacteroidota bacterium]